MTQRGKIGITAGIDCILRARLDAGVAFPAHIRLDIERAAIGLVDVHDVGRTDVDAVSATVAAGHINKGRHTIRFLFYRRPVTGLSVIPGLETRAAEFIRLVGRCREIAPRNNFV